MIKFRAWDKNTERMWDIETWHIVDEYVDLIEPGKSIADINAERFWRKQSEIILMQFTGLKDVNGKDIYEGDIVENERGEILRVSYSAIDASFVAGNCYFGSIGAGKEIRIIGNVHENPELLEE